MARRSIGYFDDGALRAGTGRYLAEIIGALDRDRYEPVFFAPEPRPWHEDLSQLGVEMVYGGGQEPGTDYQLPATSYQLPVTVRLPAAVSWSAGLARDTARLVRLFRRRSVDLVHSNNTGAEPAPVAARLARVPTVMGTLHVLPSYDLDGTRSGPRFRLLERASMRSLDHVIACCDVARREWDARCGLPAARVTVIHNGIRLERVARRWTRAEARERLGLPPDAFVTATVGNLHRYKGQEHLVRAVATVAARHPRVMAAVAGTGPDEAALRALVEELGVGGNVRLMGFCSDVGELLDAADAFVQASLVEAFPIAILEAAATGLPVIATAVGGVPEAIAEGETGLLVPPANPAALARAICALIECPARAAEYGAAGARRVAERFTVQQMLAKTTAIYDRLLG
ncbi:MAG TPA: glycosyltransferase family 4 protein [Chthonomonadaceae bacterium]|nr:glycosyltransferase family 4 protein [Chthonomonadaceae bacterium]